LRVSGVLRVCSHVSFVSRRYLQNNTLNGSVPYWICDIYSYDLSNNQFACPLRRCCSFSGNGNGLCEPCFNVTSPPPPSSSVDCCLYTNATTRDPAGVQCAGTNGCIALAGVGVTAFRQVDECGTCFKHTGAPDNKLTAACTPIGLATVSPVWSVHLETSASSRRISPW
jgi:hypothetical protein